MTALLLLSFLFSASITHANLQDSIPTPFYEVQYGSQNTMMALNRGEAALQKRIDLIRNAQNSVEVEYYIFNTDMAGKIILRELVAAADRGVKVRVLVDKLMAVYQLDTYYAKELATHNIEVRYYNTSFLLKISSIHYRNHRKLIVVDDTFAITGGRNIGDDYFNLSSKFNFEDRDVLVHGPMAKNMRESFDEYFSSKIAYLEAFPKRPRYKGGTQRDQARSRSRIKLYERRTKETKEFLEESSQELDTRKEIERIARLQLADNKIHSCPVTTFVTDAPGSGFVASHSKGYLDKYRHVRKVFLEKFHETDKEITLSTPYFIANKRNSKLLDMLLEQNIKVNLYTNSLISTDAVVMASNFYLHLTDWLAKGINVHLNDGKWTALDETMEAAQTSRWGTHAKTHVYESSKHSEVMIGTYNIDNRSDYYNSELAVFCRNNEEFSQEVKADILNHANAGIKVHSNKKATDRDGNDIGVTGASTLSTLKMNLMTFPSWLIDFLL